MKLKLLADQLTNYLAKSDLDPQEIPARRNKGMHIVEVSYRKDKDKN